MALRVVGIFGRPNLFASAFETAAAVVSCAPLPLVLGFPFEGFELLTGGWERGCVPPQSESENQESENQGDFHRAVTEILRGLTVNSPEQVIHFSFQCDVGFGAF